jgi:acyl-CoA synthetase (AMP-forming)/AMP-acid ligase II
MTLICYSHPTNVLTDGIHSCQYQDIPAVFSQLREFFTQKGIRPQDGVVLDCENSLPSALVLLFLFEHNYHFLLSKTENSSKIPPQFCRYQLQIQAISLNPHDFLTIIEHPTHAHSFVNNDIPRLYLRTSGSTGKPKIIVHTHEKMRGNIAMCVQRLGFTAENRVALSVPISHLFGLGAGFLPAVSVGASIDIQKSANILRYLQREKEFNPNRVLMTPIFCETLLKGRKTARPYQLTVVAGDCLREGVFKNYEALFGCLVQLYGSTEMGAIAAGNPNDSSELRAKAIGLPMEDVAVRIDKTTAEMNNSRQDGGEIWCQRRYSFAECWDDQGQPIISEQIDADGWFGTRDLGRVLPNGYIEVLGRCDHSIKRDGLLVLFADVETALQTIEGVESVAVIARGESLRGKGLWAYCVLNDKNQTTSAAIRSACFELLPKRAIPDKVIILENLPLLPNGKIDRQFLLTLDE